MRNRIDINTASSAVASMIRMAKEASEETDRKFRISGPAPEDVSAFVQAVVKKANIRHVYCNQSMLRKLVPKSPDEFLKKVLFVVTESQDEWVEYDYMPAFQGIVILTPKEDIEFQNSTASFQISFVLNGGPEYGEEI